MAQVWIMWVETSEVKESVGYVDSQVSLDSMVEQKAPTQRQVQELREKMDSMWGEDEISIVATGSVAQSMHDLGTGQKTRSWCQSWSKHFWQRKQKAWCQIQSKRQLSFRYRGWRWPSFVYEHWS